LNRKRGFELFVTYLIQIKRDLTDVNQSIPQLQLKPKFYRNIRKRIVYYFFVFLIVSVMGQYYDTPNKLNALL